MSNANTNLVEITEFGKLNQSDHPSKIGGNEFTLKENLVIRKSAKKSLAKRYGIQVFNNNAIGDGAVIDLYEAKLNTNYHLIAKENTGGSSSVMKYKTGSTYSGSWSGTLSSSETNACYHYNQFKDTIYMMNRSNNGSLGANKVWLGGASLFEHGAIPSDYWNAGTSFLAVASGATGGQAAGRYFYIVTNLYDNYQESASFDVYSIILSAGQATSVILPIVTNSRVKARKIYRSKAQSVGASYATSDYDFTPPPRDFYYLTTEQNTASIYTFVDSKNDDELGVAINISTFFDQKKPYRSRMSTIVKNRLVQANLEDNPLRYSAITSGNISITEVATGGLLSAGTYKFRLYKAYANHSADQLVYVVGNYTEVSYPLAGGGTTNSLKVALLNTTDDFDDWCDLVYVERTVKNGSTFYPSGIMRKTNNNNNGTVGTHQIFSSDAELLTYGSSYKLPLDIIKITNLNGLQPYDRTTNTKYKSTIAISDVGCGDLFPSGNIKVLDSKDNKGITGIFTEENRVVMFTSNNIYGLDTVTVGTEFWAINKLIDNIGAAGQNNHPSTETYGHNGILQLPDNSGYIFFNKAYSADNTVNIIIYYWNGNDNNQPVIISDDIINYLNDGFTTFTVRGMCFDPINNWVWISIKNTSQYIFVYDVIYKEWYVFTFTNSGLEYYGIICTEAGEILIGAKIGIINKYKKNTFRDTYYTDSEGNYDTKILFKTKGYDSFDADLNLVRTDILAETTSATTTSSTLTVTPYGQSDSTYSLSTVSGYIHKIQKNMNHIAKRLFVKYENSENKDILINKIRLEFKELHKDAAGS